MFAIGIFRPSSFARGGMARTRPKIPAKMRRVDLMMSAVSIICEIVVFMKCLYEAFGFGRIEGRVIALNMPCPFIIYLINRKIEPLHLVTSYQELR